MWYEAFSSIKVFTWSIVNCCDNLRILTIMKSHEGMNVWESLQKDRKTVSKIREDNEWISFVSWPVSWLSMLWRHKDWHVRAIQKNTWWRHQMETFSALLAICTENSPGTGEFSAQRPVTRSIHVFFDLRLNKSLSKQSWGWWFETLSHPLWRRCNAKGETRKHPHTTHTYMYAFTHISLSIYGTNTVHDIFEYLCPV